jgi:hypothetical protein
MPRLSNRWRSRPSSTRSIDQRSGTGYAAAASTDPVAELAAGMEWVRRLMDHLSGFSTAPLLLAVLPDTPHTRGILTSLKDAAEEQL